MYAKNKIRIYNLSKMCERQTCNYAPQNKASVKKKHVYKPNEKCTLMCSISKRYSIICKKQTNFGEINLRPDPESNTSFNLE